MKRKAFVLANCLFHLLLFGNAIASNGNTTTPQPTSSTINTILGSTTATSLTVTTPGANPTASDPTSSGTNTSAAPQGHLRPWEVALIALASVAMAVILSVGFVLSLRTSPCLKNLNTDLYHPYDSKLGSGLRGHQEMRRRPGATRPGSRAYSPPVAMQLIESHNIPEEASSS
ncbi:mucin-21 [Dipodomys merriami]|uniref:mucin-21 n=1 Tax=Dipodomys merriami TaxID=94247 RepID=UPI003855EFBB